MNSRPLLGLALIAGLVGGAALTCAALRSHPLAHPREAESEKPQLQETTSRPPARTLPRFVASPQEAPPFGETSGGQRSPAFERARALTQGAATVRRWTEQDRAALRRLLPQMADTEVERTLLDLAQATNGGGLQIETAGPPI